MGHLAQSFRGHTLDHAHVCEHTDGPSAASVVVSRATSSVADSRAVNDVDKLAECRLRVGRDRRSRRGS